MRTHERTESGWAVAAGGPKLDIGRVAMWMTDGGLAL